MDRHRIHLPKEISDLLPWYRAGKECDALAMPSPHGGLIVLSPDAKNERDADLKQLEEMGPLTPELLASEDLARALHLRLSWSVRIGADGRFTLPKGVREGRLLPASPDAAVAVVVVLGAIQIWGLDDLPDAARRLATSYRRP